MKIRWLLVAFILLLPSFLNGASVKFGDKYYDINPFTGKQDLYIDKFSNLKDSNTITLPISTNAVISNTDSFENKQFNISSATIINFVASTITTQNLYVNDQVILATITAHTFRGIEIFVSSINGSSPLQVHDIQTLSFRDGTTQYTAATSFSSSSVILNTDTFEDKKFNISSGTLSEISVSCGTVKMAESNLEMNGNYQFFSKDKQTYAYFDENNRWYRFFIEGIEAYRIEK